MFHSKKIYWVILSIFFVHPIICQAQETKQVMTYHEYKLAEKTINDSLQAAEKYLEAGNATKVELLTTELLKKYTTTTAWYEKFYNPAPYTYRPLLNYPANVYAMRARAREAQKKYKAAEADLTLALSGYPKRYIVINEPEELQRALQYYEIRARLRLKHLRNKSGGCADLIELDKMDSAKAASLGNKICVMPRLKYAVTKEEILGAQLAASDSLVKAETELAQKHYAVALRILNNLIAGKVARFERFEVKPEYSKLKVKLPGQMWGMRAQAKEGLGNYQGAIADLDTAISKINDRCSVPGDGLWRYHRGLLRIDYLQDKAGGCSDLVRAYQCDTTSTSPGHPKWRDCMLPAYKRVIGQQEAAKAQKAQKELSIQIDTLLKHNQYEEALRLSTNILRGRVGKFENVWLPSSTRETEIFTRHRRSKALIGLQRYPEALAELDSAIRLNQAYSAHGWLYCERGALKLDFMNDASGCDDLKTCYQQGYKLKDKNWRNCKFKERTAGYKFNERYIDPVFEELTSVDLQLGVFNQGKTGASIGAYLSQGEWLINWGPSVGVEVLSGYKSRAPILAPKLGFEGNFGFYSARLDFGYYSYKGEQDLRFTPQAGVSLLTVINVLYGYSIPLLSYEQPFLSRNRITLYINFVEMSKIGG